MSIPLHLPIPIHENKHSETQIMWIELGRFKKSAIHALTHGHVWGCYLTKNGNVAYRDNNRRSYYRILKKAKSTLLAVFILLNSFAFSQNKVQCIGITKSGIQCTRKVDSVYCVQHNPAAIHCADSTKTGKPCSRVVKKIGDKCFQHNKATSYLYNAYSPEYDENFVLRSYNELPSDTIVHFDDNAVATIKKTPYTAIIISIYSK